VKAMRGKERRRGHLCEQVLHLQGKHAPVLLFVLFLLVLVLVLL